MKKLTFIALLAIIVISGCNSEQEKRKEADIAKNKEIYTMSANSAISNEQLTFDDEPKFYMDMKEIERKNIDSAAIYVDCFKALVETGKKFTYDNKSNKFVKFKFVENGPN